MPNGFAGLTVGMAVPVSNSHIATATVGRNGVVVVEET